METLAYFSNIRSHIQTELKTSKDSIFVAVAWFTDAKLFDILCQKATSGLDVQLIVMDDEITRNCSIDYRKLEVCGGKVFLINNEITGTLMHNKFCVVDKTNTITGSYNWSIKAQSNHENITITRDSEELAEMFLSEFKRIKIQYHGKDPLKKFDVEIVSKRLTIIENSIQLNELENIKNQIDKISEFQLPSEVQVILEKVNSLKYADASTHIKEYLIRLKALTIFEDVGLEQLIWQIKYLEVEIIALENEKATIEKIISDFVHSYTIAFGELILKILKLKKEKLRTAGRNARVEEYEKAEEEFNKFNEQYKQEKKNDIKDLSDEEKDELKQKYRKAVLLCHPDKFTDDKQKEKAHKIFVLLQEAYSKNNLKKVREILSNLEKGIYEIDEETKVSKKVILLDQLNYLKQRLEELHKVLEKIRNDKTYKDVLSIKNMEEYFNQEKERLELELKAFENEQ
ncbi:phospholipase D-like domain-containing protein [Aquirufa nivalisilvae]